MIDYIVVLFMLAIKQKHKLHTFKDFSFTFYHTCIPEQVLLLVFGPLRFGDPDYI
jgi:hypothetical protein